MSRSGLRFSGRTAAVGVLVSAVWLSTAWVAVQGSLPPAWLLFVHAVGGGFVASWEFGRERGSDGVDDVAPALRGDYRAYMDDRIGERELERRIEERLDDGELDVEDPDADAGGFGGAEFGLDPEDVGAAPAGDPDGGPETDREDAGSGTLTDRDAAER